MACAIGCHHVNLLLSGWGGGGGLYMMCSAQLTGVKLVMAKLCKSNEQDLAFVNLIVNSTKCYPSHGGLGHS